MSDTASCAACGSANEAGRKFCGECGSALSSACPSCGTPNAPGVKFCGECGTALTPSATPSAPTPAGAPAAERRLVSVLFADLVGFTTLSETRDSEEVRELLSRYFETSRRLIELYGGTVEKFIGDAVMAVWGTPIATEDDAERAVRAALDLVAAVSALGDEVDAADLQARAGVLTGEAAVTLGAEGQGMVAGDLVNTASRVQSVAEPGTVFVGETTRRATEPTIVFAEAGSYELKGKEEPIPLWQALRVVSGARGTLKSIGLEAPFVGRDGELRRIKDLFHTSADEGRAHLVSLTGIAGIGKSRLAWEFYKYFDGLPQLTYWHRGRCLAYGEGVAYWALADMVRMRCRIAEDEDQGSAQAKLRAALEEHVPDAGERAFVEPRLAQLLGFAESEAPDRQDLFAAWRLFFERLAEVYPTVLAFEDMQWADASLLDFVEHLLDWSRNHPLFVITLARPELLERRPTWGAGQRNFTSIFVEPLPEEAMGELLDGLVPGLPGGVREQILGRAEGVPLYAVETVRMLLDRGALVQEGSVYRTVGEIDELDVPETLHALIAARLDGLSPEERQLLQDGAVLGKTFTERGVAALAGDDETDVRPLLTALVRKEVLSLQTDPRSPEHGQYGFLQDLVRHVAYETLGRRGRRSRHLAAADFLAHDSGMDPSEIAEVIAAHYLDAYTADESAPDAAEAKASAQAWFVRAAERARSLAAAAEAQRGFERAAALAVDDGERADLLHQAGTVARMAGDTDAAKRHLADAMAIYRGLGRLLEEAQASSKLAEMLFFAGRIEESVELMDQALGAFVANEDEAAEATVSAQLARFLFFEGELERALAYVERSLEVGERLHLPEAVSQALNTKALLLQQRPYESVALMRGALEAAREHDLNDALSRAYINLSYLLWVSGASNYEIEDVIREGLAYTRRRGDREGELGFVAQLAGGLYEEGRWDELEQLVAELPEDAADRVGNAVGFQLPACLALIAYHRGDPPRARALVEGWAASQPSVDKLDESCRVWALALTALVDGRIEKVFALARPRIEAPANTADLESHLDLAGEATTDVASANVLSELLDFADAADVPKPPSAVAGVAYLRAKVAALRGEEPDFERAVRLLRESDRRFMLAAALVEQAAWLASHGRPDEAAPLVEEARTTFERLDARPWLERIESARARATVTA